MLKERDAVIRRFMRVLDIIMILAAFPIAYYFREKFHLFYTLDIFPSAHIVGQEVASFGRYISFLVIVAPIWVITLDLLGTYRSIRTSSFFHMAWIVFKSAVYTVFLSAAFAFILKIEYVSRILFVSFIFFSFIFLLTEKCVLLAVVHYIRRMGYNYRRLLIVGTGGRAQYFVGIIEAHPEWGFRISGVVDDEGSKVGQKFVGHDIIGTLDDIPDILHKRAIDEVIFVVPRSWLNKMQASIAACELEGIKATLAVDLFDLKIAHAVQSELEGIPLITFEPTLGHEGQLFIKRTADLIFSALALILLSPVFLITAILIKLTSRGPVFFAQKRVGQSGRRFVLFKFRSMYYGAQKRLTELERLNEASGPVFKIKNDPRITPTGRFLRKFSIDEFPQFVNVFMGDMSIVGPRPPLPREVRQYEPWQRRRLSMRPGLTCFWQVSGRSRIAFDEWIKMDLKYIDNWSLWLDFKIFVKTIPVVILGIGAH